MLQTAIMFCQVAYLFLSFFSLYTVMIITRGKLYIKLTVCDHTEYACEHCKVICTNILP